MFIKNKNKVLLKNKVTLNRGFTLIELLVVIAIIGILGSIVYAPFQTARRKGRDAQKIVEMKNLQASLFLYADSNSGYFPESLTALQDSMSDRLPTKSNLTNTWDANKYNYVAYAQNGKVVGFHLITHLETASPVLSGSASCRGIVSGSGLSPCIVGSGVSIQSSATTAGFVSEQDSTVAKLLQSERTGDTDANCATDTSSCIYDLKS